MYLHKCRIFSHLWTSDFEWRYIVGEDSVQYRKYKKHCFLAAAILLFIGKIIITW